MGGGHSSVPGRCSNQDAALQALTAPVDQLDTKSSGVTSCDSTAEFCQWSPRKLWEGDRNTVTTITITVFGICKW